VVAVEGGLAGPVQGLVEALAVVRARTLLERTLRAGRERQVRVTPEVRSLPRRRPLVALAAAVQERSGEMQTATWLVVLAEPACHRLSRGLRRFMRVAVAVRTVSVALRVRAAAAVAALEVRATQSSDKQEPTVWAVAAAVQVAGLTAVTAAPVSS